MARAHTPAPPPPVQFEMGAEALAAATAFINGIEIDPRDFLEKSTHREQFFMTVALWLLWMDAMRAFSFEVGQPVQETLALAGTEIELARQQWHEQNGS